SLSMRTLRSSPMVLPIGPLDPGPRADVPCQTSTPTTSARTADNEMPIRIHGIRLGFDGGVGPFGGHDCLPPGGCIGGTVIGPRRRTTKRVCTSCTAMLPAVRDHSAHNFPTASASYLRLAPD